MIQRIQTLYLLLAGLLVSAMFFLPLLSIRTLSGNYELTLLGIEAQAATPYFQGVEQYVLIIVSLWAAYFPLRTIFAFSNRRRQMRFSLYAVFFIVLQLVVLAGVTYRLYINDASSSLILYLSLILPLAAIACCILAFRAILRDDRMIRSVDRIR